MDKDITALHKMHVDMWMWIANKCIDDKKQCTKMDFFLAHPAILEPSNKCYACEACKETVPNPYFGDSPEEPAEIVFGDCSKCPIDWGNSSNLCIDANSIYADWVSCPLYDYNRAAAIAYKIAELPWHVNEN